MGNFCKTIFERFSPQLCTPESFARKTYVGYYNSSNLDRLKTRVYTILQYTSPVSFDAMEKNFNKFLLAKFKEERDWVPPPKSWGDWWIGNEHKPPWVV